jgi:hypothetical protein
MGKKRSAPGVSDAEGRKAISEAELRLPNIGRPSSASHVAVYDGSTLAGDGIERADDNFETFTALGKLVGRLTTRIAASRSIPASSISPVSGAR